MADRKEEIIEASEPYDMGLRAEDVTLDRLRIVSKSSHLFDPLGVAMPGDIAAGIDAEDEDSTVLWTAKTGGPGVVAHVLAVHINYGCKFNEEDGQWEEGDPEMPACARRQYNYMLCIPAYDTRYPVLYTASSTAAKHARGMNKQLDIQRMVGLPYELAFEITSKVSTGGGYTWPSPVFKLIEPSADSLAVAKRMFEEIVGVPVKQLPAAGVDDEMGV